MAGLADDLIQLRENKVGDHLKDFLKEFLPNIKDLDDVFAVEVILLRYNDLFNS